MPRWLPISAAARAAAACLALAGTRVPAFGQDRELVGRLPASAEAVVVVHDAATVVREVSRSPLVLMVPGAAVFQQTARAWKRLSDRLGWTQDETADRLIGGTCILVLTERADAGGWAVLTTVSGDTERRLRERLELAPADIVAGQPVLALKDAELLLAVRRDEGLQPGRARLLLLGPAGQDGGGLFHQMLPSLNPHHAGGEGGATLARTGVFPHVADAGPDAAVYLQLAEGRAERWSQFAAISAGAPGGDGALTAAIILRHAETSRSFAGVPGLSTSAVEAFAGDAAGAMIACIPRSPDEQPPWRIGTKADNGLDRVAVLIGRAPSRTLGLAISPPGEHSPGPAVIAMLEGRAPGAGDDSLETTLGSGSGEADRLPPGVRRRARLDVKPGSGVARLTGHPVEAAWRTSGTWWCAGVARENPPTGGGGGAVLPLQDVERRLAALDAAVVSSPDAARRWIFWARLDPALVMEAAPGPWPSGSPTRAMLERMQKVWLGAWIEPDGLIRGSLRVEVAPRPAGAAAP